MAAKAGGAKIASAARGIDLAGDASPDEALVGAANNFADELVARDSSISHVTADQFEIGATNAGKTYAHETFARCRLRIGIVVAQSKLAVEAEGTHQIGAAAGGAGVSIETKIRRETCRVRDSVGRFGCGVLVGAGLRRGGFGFRR